MENEFRGREAAGVAYVKDRQVMFVKQKGTATELARAITDGTWGDISVSPLGLLHTRAPTQGSPNENSNNHPVIGNGWVVVHNGSVWNDKALYKHFNTPRIAEVDTAALNLLLGQGQTVEESLPHVCTLRGSASVAAVHIHKPDELLLFRLGGPPVHLYWLPALATFVWSSDPDGAKAVEGLPGNGFAEFQQAYILPDKTALHLYPGGLRRYELVPKPYGPAWGGGSFGFFPQTPSHGGRGGRGGQYQRSSGSKRVVIPQGQYALAVLASNAGLLEEPVFNGSRQEYHYRQRYDHYVPNEGEFVLPTGYGRWSMKRVNGEIVKEFLPHRRVKRRWEKEFGDEGGAPHYRVSLPAIGEQQNDLSDLLQLAKVDLMFADGSSSPALICPWCGVLRHPQGWATNDHTCEWCDVKSRPPKEVTDAK